MTDRELLERAARAAGINAKWYDTTGCMMRTESGEGLVRWEPQSNDGDAFRLLTLPKLGLELHGFGALREVIFMMDGEPQSEEVEWPHTPSSTRRAIVRAAAAMAPEEAR